MCADIKSKDEQIHHLTVQLEMRTVEASKLRTTLEQTRKQFWEEEARLKGDLHRMTEEANTLKRRMTEAQAEFEELQLIEKRRVEDQHAVTS